MDYVAVYDRGDRWDRHILRGVLGMSREKYEWLIARSRKRKETAKWHKGKAKTVAIYESLAAMAEAVAIKNKETIDV